MNIKIIFKGKIHKLPKEIQTLESVRNTIQQIYPEELKYGFNLYTKIDESTLNSTLEQGPVRIEYELHFQFLKKQHKSQSMKILVKEGHKGDITDEEIHFLEQSQFNQNNKRNSDNEQQNKTINEFILKLIDERLKFHGLIAIQPNYKMTVAYSLQEVMVNPGCHFLWKIELLNTGNVTWKKDEIFLECIQGAYQDFQLSQDIPPEEIGTFSSKLIAPRLPGYFKTQIFRLCQKQRQKTYFGKEIYFQFFIPRFQKQTHSTQEVQNLLEKTIKNQALDNSDEMLI